MPAPRTGGTTHAMCERMSRRTDYGGTSLNRRLIEIRVRAAQISRRLRRERGDGPIRATAPGRSSRSLSEPLAAVSRAAHFGSRMARRAQEGDRPRGPDNRCVRIPAATGIAAFTGSRVPGAPRRAVSRGRDSGARLPQVRQGSTAHGHETHPSWASLGGVARCERGRGLRRFAVRFGACPPLPLMPWRAPPSQGTCRTLVRLARRRSAVPGWRRSHAIIWRLALSEVGRCRNLG